MTNISLLFPGQGAQFVGMGREFYDASPEAKKIFDAADKVIPHLKEVIFNGPPEKLTSTAFCQPAIFTYSVAALEAFKAHPKFKNVEVKFAAGLSLGELSAVYASGALSFEEALKVVERRSFFMEEATKKAKGAMAAVLGFDKQKLIEICQATGAEVANYNSPDQIVITGHADKVAVASQKIQEAGAKRVIALEVSGAFHSTLMQPAVAPFENELAKFSFKQGHFPVVTNVDGKPYAQGEEIRRNLAKQITSSVQWVETINFMASQGVEQFLEIGPGTVLKGLGRKINPALKIHNIQKPEDLEVLVF